MKAEESKNDPVTGLPTQDLPDVLEDVFKQAKEKSPEHIKKLEEVSG